MKLGSCVRAIIIVAVLAAPAASQASSIVGRITKYSVSMSTNLPFRIYTDVVPADCPGGFMYVEWTEPAYQTYVTGLITAYAQQKSVAITYVIGTGGYCRVIEYQVG